MSNRSTPLPGVAVLLALVLGVVVIGAVATGGVAGQSDADENVTEPEYVEPAPEPGDEYFEAVANDGSWISYDNPRDEYRSPYLGDGSGKICVTLVNENGDPIVGEAVPNTTITVPTGESTSWHTGADPMTVELPMTDNYQRPLDGDQFGTSPDIAQGDGYMDAHCIEMHGHPEDETINYGEAEIDGEHAEHLEVVGYVQQANMDGWDTDVDPVADAESYEEAGGSWTYRPGASHGQVVVVVQLDPADDSLGTADGSDTGGSDADETDSDEDGAADGGTGTADEPSDDESGDESDDMPGFGVGVALVALVVAVVARYRR